jgi:hypothetical protein
MDVVEPFPASLEGWRRDLLNIGRPLVALGGVGLLSVVLLVAIFGGGSAGAARNGAVCLALLLLLVPPFLPPVTYWSDWTATRRGDLLYVETFLGGRRVLRVSEVRHVATRMTQGRSGTTYYAAIWSKDRTTPTVILTWEHVDSPTRALVREIASGPSVSVSRRARAHLDLPGAPSFLARVALACRTLTLFVAYVAAVGVIGWEYAYLLGGEGTANPFSG